MEIFLIILEFYSEFSVHTLYRFCDPQYKVCDFFPDTEYNGKLSSAYKIEK